MTSIPMNERLAIHAMLDELVADGATFNRVQAAELIRRLPLSKRSSPFQLRGWWQGTDSAEGLAAGVGQAQIDDESTKSVAVGADRRWRIGGFKIDHTPGLIEVALIWDGTHEDESGRTCRLTYDTGNGNPEAMYLARDLTISLGPLKLTYGRAHDRWKEPV